MTVFDAIEEYRPLQKLQKSHDRSIIGVEFFKQGRGAPPLLATFGHDNIKLWNVSTFDDEIDVSEKTSNGKISSWRCGIQSYDVAENGKLIAVLSVESTLFVISIAKNGQYTKEQFNNGLMAMWFIRISPDHDTFLTANFSGSLQLLDRSAQVVKTVPFEKVKLISAMEYSPTGKYVAVGNSHGWIFVLSGQTLLNIYQIEGHSMKIRCLEFTPEEQHLLSGADDKTIKLYSLTESKGVFVRNFCGHQGSVLTICFDKSSAGERFASAGTDNQVIVWDLEAGVRLHVFNIIKSVDFIRCLAFYPDGRFLVAGTDDSTILTYKVPQPDNYIEEEEEEMVLEDEEELQNQQEEDTNQQMLSQTDTDAENPKYNVKEDEEPEGYQQPGPIQNNYSQQSPAEGQEGQEENHKVSFEDEETGFYPQISGQQSAANYLQSSIPDSQALAIDTQYDSQMPPNGAMHSASESPEEAAQNSGNESAAEYANQGDEKMDESSSQQPVNYQEEFERRELERELGID